MATENATIWDLAKQDAQRQNKSVKKQQIIGKLQSLYSGPVAIMKLMMLVMVVYALIQYIPAFVNLKKLVTQTNIQSGAQTQIDSRKNWGIFEPVLGYTKIKKAYVRAGNTFSVQYALPQNAEAKLVIKRCRSIIFIEVFNCQVMQSEVIDISGETVGTRRIQVADSAIYVFEHQVNVKSGEPFDVTWHRH